MKNKVLSAIKIISAGLAMLLCCAVFATTIISKAFSETERVVGTYRTIDGKAYSSIFDDGIILNVEKVKTFNEGEHNEMQYGNAVDKIIKFDDISSASTTNTAVNNNGYLWLENEESILISLGQYVTTEGGIKIASKLNDDNKTMASGSFCANIRSLNLDIRHYGNGSSGSTNVSYELRNIYNGSTPTYVDLALSLANEEGVDGYYQLIFDYTYNSNTVRATFGFFVVRASTYNASVTDGSDSYSVSPTIKVDDTTYTSSAVNRYFIQNSNQNFFPTLTYDCTKVGVTYHHTTNGLRTDYILDYSIDRQSNGVLTITKKRNDTVIGTFTYDNIGKAGVKNNIVSIVFTEIGEYTFDFSYKYVGVVPTGVETPTINEKINSVSMVIHGYELAYFRPDADYAELRYYNIATSNHTITNNDYSVSVIVPNGYNKDWTDSKISSYIDFCEQKMGLVYSLTASTEKAGKILTRTDALKTNEGLTNSSKLPGAGDYVKTNQGYLRLLTNDTFTSDSYYFYSSSPITNLDGYMKVSGMTEDLFNEYRGYGILYTYSSSYVLVQSSDSFNSGTTYYSPYTKITNMSADIFSRYVAEGVLYTYSSPTMKKVEKGSYDNTGNTNYYEINKKPFSSLTSFTKKGGYYLLILKVNPNDGKAESDTTTDYYQVFAFRYMSDETSLTLKDESDKALSSNDYTNGQITVSWTEPGLFDKKIKVEYYTALNNKDITVNEMKNLTSTGLTQNQSYVGANIANGQFARLLFKVSSVGGESATYTLVTIDKEPIKNVKSYLIEAAYSGSNKYFRAVRNNSGNLVSTNGILSGYATLDWNEKASGARIDATYSYAPFVTGAILKEIEVNRAVGLTNGYKLGATQTGYTITKNSDTYLNNIDTSNVISGQGIYVFELKDQAGNEYKYAMIIDDTPAYFEIDGEIFTRDSRIYSDSKTFDVKAFKAIELGTLSGEDVVNRFLRSSSEVNNDAELFTSGIAVGTADGKYQLVVNNLKVYSYSEGSSTIEYNTNGTIEKTIGSLRVRLYAISANQIYSTGVAGYKGNYTANKSNSFVDIEINTDRSELNIWVSDVMAEDDILEGSNTYIRFDGKAEQDSALASGLKFANITIKLRNTTGIDTFEVGRVYFKYCARSESGFVNPNTVTATTIYNKVGGGLSSAHIVGDELYFSFGNTIGSADGLYIITRVYDGDVPVDDQRELTYFFIVDKEKIVDNTKGIGQGNILNLLETENNINMAQYVGSYSSSTDTCRPGENVSYKYVSYVQTNKLPAIMSVPSYKFYDVVSGKLANVSKYYAGRLDLEIYYVDKYHQFERQNNDTAYLIYSGILDGEVDLESNTFKAKIYNYLLANPISRQYSNGTVYLKDLFDSSNGNWTFVPGDYVFVIKDRVRLGATQGDYTYKTNEVVLAYRINNNANKPTITVEVGPNNDNLSSPVRVNKDEYRIVTNQDILKITIPNYDSSATVAKVDNNYIVITGQANGKTVNMSYVYGMKQGIDYDGSGDLVLTLPTYLKDADENILTDNFNKTTQYKIKVRYKLSGGVDHEKYKNCYVVYTNGVASYYYEAEYTITVDRLAPTKNINSLKQNDKLLASYEATLQSRRLNEDTAIENGNGYLFVNRYADYYMYGKQLKDIYAFTITENYEFDTSDGDIYYRRLENASSINLNLPSAGYEKLQSKLTAVGNGAYYEIIEEDLVGNICQYVVYVTNNTDSFGIEFNGVTNENISTEPLFSINSIKLSSNRAFYQIVLERLDRSSGVIVHRTVYETISNISNQNDSYSSIETAIKNSLTVGQRLNVGNYQLSVYGQEDSRAIISVALNLYSMDNIREISAEEILDRQYRRVNLDKAIKYDSATNTMYYAVSVSIKKGADDAQVYTCVPSSGWIFVDKDNREVHSIDLLENTTYQIIVKNLGDEDKEPSIVWYNSSKTDFHSISFHSGDFTPGYYQEGNTYYAISNAIITFDNEIFTTGDETYNSTGEIELTAADGEIQEFNIQLMYDEKPNVTYHVIIDKRTTDGEVKLRDLLSGSDKSSAIKDAYNILRERDYESMVSSKIDNFTTGDKTLTWTRLYNEYFDYSYSIVRKTTNGDFIKETQTNGVYNIKPSENYTEDVWLVVTITSKLDSTVIGNRVYAMKVKQKSNYYYMVTLNGEEIKPNSSFKFADIETLSFVPNLHEAIVTYGNMPLYVTNEELMVSLSSDYTLEQYKSSYTNNEHVLDVYYIKSTTTAIGQAFGVYKVKSNDPDIQLDPISNLQIYDSNPSNAESISSDKVVEYSPTLTFTQTTRDTKFDKNPIVITYYYLNEDKTVSKVLSPKDGNVYEFKIEGVGPYTFEIRDLAGNIHLVGGNADFTVSVLSEIPVSINGEAYVDGAYYNKDVNVKVESISNFDATTLSVVVKRNGEVIDVAVPREFALTEAGNYEIKFTAKLKNSVDDKNSRSLRFTIVNPNEANEIFDFTPILNYRINSIISEDGQDFTELFKQLMNENGVGSVKYDDILYMLRNSTEFEDLVLTSGLSRFTVNYTVVEEAYPDREIETTFAMNNQKPTISCTLKPGESTKDSFKISYNPGVIYSQIGESKIYINDNLIYTIDENSKNEIVENEISFKNNGAKDYQIKLETSSGLIKSSYVVTIEAPLNTSAIIIIVVVSAVVVGVIVTIIVLRKKMRIR